MEQAIENGGVGKRLTPAVLKTVRPERVSWVRIPPPPPASAALSTGCATRPTAWKPRRLRECGGMPPVVASLQAVIAYISAEQLQSNDPPDNQIENPV